MQCFAFSVPFVCEISFYIMFYVLHFFALCSFVFFCAVLVVKYKFTPNRNVIINLHVEATVTD